MAQITGVAAASTVGVGRLVALDAFRGATIALMVLVNTAGGSPQSYGPLLHADWHGWTLTDTVFPSFLWIVGLSLTLSLSKRVAAGVPRRQLVPSIFRRGLIIYLLGLFLYMFPTFDLSTARLLGVLQRIAICYVIASLIFLYTSVRTQILCIVGLLLSYWALMTMVPVPGFGAGRLDEAGNFAHYIDKIVLGRHNYVYTKTWDPEGIISTIPAIATALLGVMASHILRIQRALSERTTWMYLTGVGLLVAGLICDTWLPINKKLWTTSFTLLMAGLDFLVFASLLWIVDGVGYRRWTQPFVILGQNAITVYMVSELGEILLSISGVRDRVYSSFYAAVLDPKNASLAYALSYVLLMFAVAVFMRRRGWMVRV